MTAATSPQLPPSQTPEDGTATGGVANGGSFIQRQLTAQELQAYIQAQQLRLKPAQPQRSVDWTAIAPMGIMAFALVAVTGMSLLTKDSPEVEYRRSLEAIANATEAVAQAKRPNTCIGLVVSGCGEQQPSQPVQSVPVAHSNPAQVAFESLRNQHPDVIRRLWGEIQADPNLCQFRPPGYCQEVERMIQQMDNPPPDITTVGTIPAYVPDVPIHSMTQPQPGDRIILQPGQPLPFAP